MSNNLYKANWISFNAGEKRVIDNNELLQEKLSKSMNQALHSASYEEVEGEPVGFVDGIEAPEVDALFTEDGAKIPQESQEELDQLRTEIEAARAELADVKAQADTMIENAKAEIGAMQMKAYEEAKSQGLQEGERIGRQEADAEKESFLQKKAELEAEYESKINDLEPELVNVITDIYEHIFKVDLSDYEGLVTDLILNTLQKTDGEKNFFIHVAAEDYEKVINSKDQIQAQAAGAKVEFISDMVLAQGQCSIETETGIYDCSLDTELAELSRKLRLLSYKQTD